MSDVTRPVRERERRESESVKNVSKREEELKAARRNIEEASNARLRRQPLKLDYQDVDRELYQLIRQHGKACLNSPETVERLSQVIEQALSKRGLGLADVRQTRDGLSQQLGEHVNGVGKNLNSFLERMDRDRERARGSQPSHTSQRLDSRSSNRGSGRSR